MRLRKIHLKRALLPEGWASDVLIVIDEAGNIASVTPQADAGDALIFAGTALPGVPNVHSHAHQRAMAGLAERAGPGPDSFWTWREVMYGFVGRIGPEDLEAIAAQLYVEMLKSGYTAVGEFQYLHHGPDGAAYDETAEMSLRTVAAAEMTGIGITSLPTLYAYGGFGGAETNPRQARFLNQADRYLEIVSTLNAHAQDRPEQNVGISPHSLRAVTPELLNDVLGELDRAVPKAPVHIHIAEQTLEVDDCIAWCGERPVEFLLNRFEIDGRWCLIHATHMTDDETRCVAKSQAVVGLCPTTEANLGDGLFPAVDYLGHDGRIAIGTDSHISVSPVEDIRLLEYGQRLVHRGRNVLAMAPGASTGRTLLDRVLSGGAQCLGRNIGVIAEGARADVIVLDDAAPVLVGRADDGLVDSWIFSGNVPCVKDVLVGGRHVVEGGHHIAEVEIFTRFQATLNRLTD
jgi:formimidoylglutamate deiminase